MTASRATLVAVSFGVWTLGIPLVHHAWAVPCNGKTPTMGNCGTEDKCEGRSGTNCTTTYGQYYEAEGGIACQDGVPNSWCGQQMAASLKCTCEWTCFWFQALGECKKDAEHMQNGEQVCSKMKEYYSQSCTFGGGH
jgi:hypothetical protein